MTEDAKEDNRIAAVLARRDAWLTEVAKEKGFDRNVVDHAVLIVRFFEATRDRYSIWHLDRDLAPILDAAFERYRDFRGHDFTLGTFVSSVEAVRKILAIPMSPDIP